jgi:hypothetical protein
MSKENARTVEFLANIRFGSIASFWTSAHAFRGNLNNRPRRNSQAGPFGATADIGKRESKFLFAVSIGYRIPE